MPNRTTALWAGAGLYLLVASASAALHPISIDDRIDDWLDVAPAYVDAVGDRLGLDLTQLSLANDNDFLFLRIEATTTFDLSESNALRLFIDTDDEPLTGTPINGIGAELEWRCGQRYGVYHDPTGAAPPLDQADISFHGAPTIDAFDFEIELALLDPIGHADRQPDCDRQHADLNGDGAVNFADIDPFVALLSD